MNRHISMALSLLVLDLESTLHYLLLCAYIFRICRSLVKQEIPPPSHVVERYIELLCRYQPEAVYNFLRANDNYRVEEALDVSSVIEIMKPADYIVVL